MNLWRRLAALGCGLLFGFGLLLSGMSNPDKVLAFLDLGGQWDPSLMLVMVGAIAMALGPMTWARRHTRTSLDCPVQLPTRHSLDGRLVVGSLIFGAGWGLAGICPGPATLMLFMGYWQAGLFFGAMLVGMVLFIYWERHRVGRVDSRGRP